MADARTPPLYGWEDSDGPWIGWTSENLEGPGSTTPSLTPDKATISVTVSQPTLGLGAISITVDAAGVVVTVTQPTLEVVGPPEAARGYPGKHSRQAEALRQALSQPEAHAKQYVRRARVLDAAEAKQGALTRAQMGAAQKAKHVALPKTKKPSDRKADKLRQAVRAGAKPKRKKR